MFSLNQILSSIFLFSIFTGPVYSQNTFIISGAIPSKYDGIEINLKSDNPTFVQLSTNVKNGKFIFLGKLQDTYEKVSLIARSDDESFGWWSFFITKGKMGVEILTTKDSTHVNDIQYSNVPFIR